MKLYFGHPVNTYGTELEERIIAEILRLFPESTVENPNQPKHQKGYDRYKRGYGNGMGYYFQEVLPECDGGIVLPFGDGALGAGVFGEARFLMDRGKPVWIIECEGMPDGPIVFVPLRPGQEIIALTAPETRARVYGPGGTRPYE